MRTLAKPLAKQQSAPRAPRPQAAPRSSNIELMRIVLMFLIVTHHSVVNSYLLSTINVADPGFNGYFIYVWGMWGKICINVFVLITGYFMCTSRFKWTKFVKLLAEIYFYSIVFAIPFMVHGDMGFRDLVSKLFYPVREIDNGFSPSFLVMYLAIPFLNAVIRTLGKKGVAGAICLGFWTQTVSVTLFNSATAFSEVIWFCVLYFVAAYIRLWPPRWANSHFQCSWIFLVNTLLSIASIVFIAKLHTMNRAMSYQVYFFVIDCSKILALTTAVAFFCWFKTLRMGYNKHINAIAATTYGVFLIHANSELMRNFIWETIWNMPSTYYLAFPLALLKLIVAAVVVFAVCSAIDMLRIRYIEKPCYGWLMDHKDAIEARFNAVLSKAGLAD